MTATIQRASFHVNIEIRNIAVLYGGSQRVLKDNLLGATSLSEPWQHVHCVFLTGKLLQREREGQLVGVKLTNKPFI